MVGIIRGIIPYISFSTLKAADKDTKKTTTSRELCFLFTDIRGFTTLCEGKKPQEVVEILNHYLDIETETEKEQDPLDKWDKIAYGYLPPHLVPKAKTRNSS